MKSLTQISAPAMVRARWPECPEMLWVLGNVSLLESPLCAMIGTRRPSPRGLAAARAWARAAGCPVLSGAAIGIDVECHAAALAFGASTVIVPAAGLLAAPIPSMFVSLLNEENHLWISPFAPATPPSRWTPLHRNRLVGALADVAIVVEAPMKSGTAHVARAMLRRRGPLYAIQYSVPAPPTADGNASLLHSGAEALPEIPIADSILDLQERLARARDARSHAVPAAAEADIFAP